MFLDLSLNLCKGVDPITMTYHNDGSSTAAGVRGLNNNIRSNELINIYDCVSEFFKTDTLDIQNKLFC